MNIHQLLTERGACVGEDAETFFPDSGSGYRLAIKICMRCDVRDECLKYALDNEISHGIWGGCTERKRDELLRERRKTA